MTSPTSFPLGIDGELPTGTAQVLRDMQLSKYVNVATFALLIYDYVATLPDEINYVWPSKWNAGKVLYLVQRYMVFIDPMLFIIYIMSPELSFPACKNLFSAFAGLAVCGNVITEIILSMRTYAIWGQSRLVLGMLVIFNFALFVSRVATTRRYLDNLQPMPYPIKAVVACSPTRFESQMPVWITYAIVIVFELTIVTLTIYKALATLECRLRPNSSPRQVRSSDFTTTLYYDAISFFVILFLLSVANEVITADPKYFNLVSLLTETQRVIHAILSGKIILHLRKAARHSPSQASFFSLEMANSLVFDAPEHCTICSLNSHA
ncbi:hypothetical protein SCHPADRAFT_644826 [Schizopora paradoxa]|uniref:DUF6533 domain-containing protein n=1 Tax=Schizopora paradoxa TaxID=27342 RepID=A0A0H2R6Q4_9AGAM|nr:hypothetical protein SCHPADRAFT_644826 [Schizopora paradoxa]